MNLIVDSPKTIVKKIEKEEFFFLKTHPQPGQHQLLRRELGTADLVVDDQRPDQAQDQLQVAVDDVQVA